MIKESILGGKARRTNNDLPTNNPARDDKRQFLFCNPHCRDNTSSAYDSREEKELKAKELLKESLEPQDCEGIKMRSIVFEHFLISIADILVIDSLSRIKGEPVGLKDFESNTFTVKDVHAILCHEDILLGLQQALHLRNFIDWFLEQDINIDDGCLWYDLDYLVKKWNEYALEAIA